ncbi:MAG: HutD family protein [Rhodanobacter sp.]
MIIRLADCPPQPWKNGLGRTREIAVQPSSAAGEDFLWRVSIAEVDRAVPFSRFPGIDRQIVLLGGAGFTMTLDGSRKHALTTAFAPFAFPGEAKVEVALAGGATRDFNLMVRRAHLCGSLQVWRGRATRAIEPSAALVFCARGEIVTADGHLGAGDAWRPSPASSGSITLHDEAIALVVRLEPRTG